jgi:hypothetical protein
MATLADLAQLSATAYNPGGQGSLDKPLPSGWSVLDVSNPSETQSGYFGVAYRNGAGEIVIANRGTEMTDIDDWRANAEVFFGTKVVGQFSSAKAFSERIIRDFGAGTTIVQTGHSLGGGLADMCAVVLSQRAVAFDSIGVKEALATMRDSNGQPLYDVNRDYSGTITNVSAWFDPAMFVGTRIGADKKVSVSLLPYVPDWAEPFVVLAATFLLKGIVARLTVPAYLTEQHDIDNLVKTLKGLGASEIRGLAPDLSLSLDGQLSGGLATAFTSLQEAIQVSPDLQATIADTTFNAQAQLQASDIAAEQDTNSTDPRSYTGTNDNDLVVGTNGSDQLSGGGGTNIVVGGSGMDWLNGGTGKNFLIGGPGYDVYLSQAGDGHSEIIDSDGNGRLIRAGQALALGVKSGDGQWSLNGTTFTRNQNGSDLDVTFADGSDEITAKNFDFASAESGNYLGIRLIDAPSAPADPVRTFVGDLQNLDGNSSHPRVDAFDNALRSDVADPNRDDFFFGSSANEVEKFQTGGGNDTI